MRAYHPSDSHKSKRAQGVAMIVHLPAEQVIQLSISSEQQEYLYNPPLAQVSATGLDDIDSMA